MPLKVDQIAPKRAFQRIASQIKENIIDGNLKPGDLLPSEASLKDIFNASRPTIREALRVLEQSGLIEIKAGAKGGAFVKLLSEDVIIENLELLIAVNQISLIQLMEFRACIEPSAAVLAARNYTESDLDIINPLKQQITHVLEKKIFKSREFLDIDLKLHLAVAKLSKNPVLKSIQKSVVISVSKKLNSFYQIQKDEIEKTLNDFLTLLDAIENKNEEIAQKVISKHLKSTINSAQLLTELLAPG